MTVEQETAAAARAAGRMGYGRDNGGPGVGPDGSRLRGYGGGNGAAGPGARGRRTRTLTVAVLVVSLIAAGLTRHWAMALQARAASTGPHSARAGAVAGGPSLGSMNSFFLALLLGGLRGPLVMFLWASSEQQKNERDLEGFDTKIELIRLLQPEFDTVHIFQIWNKAYNQSAQIASLPNKYSAVLDAVDYALKVDEGRPNSINILQSISQLYNHKLGTTAGDSIYYRKRVREDTMWRPESAREVRREGVPPRRLNPMLDAAGNILPELVAPTNPRPADAPESLEWYDGSQLQYLKRYEPFPHGISPLALGYNYAKRAQVLMNVTGQKPKQLSEAVLDSRPALMLKEWSEEESERAREMEMRAFGVPVPPPVQRERQTLEMPTAKIPLDTRVDDLNGDSQQARLLRDAIYGYEFSARLARDSAAEYRRHLSNTENYINEFQNFSSHLDALAAQGHLARGDAAYLRAMALPRGTARDEAMHVAFENYRAANIWYQYSNLRYYTPLEVFPPGFNRETLTQMRDVELQATQGADARPLSDLYAAVEAKLKTWQGADENFTERTEYEPYKARARQRAGLLHAAARGAGAGGAGGAADPASPASQPAEPARASPSTQPAAAPPAP